MKLSELMSITTSNTHIMIDDYVGPRHWNIHTESPFKVIELIDRGVVEDSEIATVEIKQNIHEGKFFPPEMVVYLEIDYSTAAVDDDLQELFYRGRQNEPR
ncbi:MAG: hypothetical protein J6V38_02495 [Kiritimatiellae bacterium]|nr:hypothetical protein [Kiritimatiellia bacterium]